MNLHMELKYIEIYIRMYACQNYENNIYSPVKVLEQYQFPRLILHCSSPLGQARERIHKTVLLL
jgi:hypothetical protein